MVEDRALPVRGCVTHRAVGRESGGLMIWVVGSLPIRLMATDAIGRDREIAGGVALVAGQRGVRSSERELRAGMIEFSALPLDRGVTQ